MQTPSSQTCPAGHESLSNVLISYFPTQLCAPWNVANGKAFDSCNVPADSGHPFGGVGQRQGLPEPPIGNEEEMEPGLASSQKTRNNVIHQNLLVATPYSSRPHQHPASSDPFLEIAHSAPPQTALSTFSPHGSARLPHTFGSHLATRLFPQAKHWVHFVTRGSYYIEYQLMGEGGQMVPMYKVITDLLDRPIYGLRLNVELFSRFSL